MKDSDAPTEIELTLRLSPDAIGRLRRLGLLTRWRAGRASSRRLVATYFDTPDFSLRDQQVALRVRRIGGRHIQTVKQADAQRGLLTRLEDEVEVPSGSPDVSVVGDKKLRRLLTAPEVARRLKPVFVTNFRRSIMPLEVRGAQIELALDEGEITTEGGRVAICEAELELKQGGVGAVYEVAQALTLALPATVETLSKAERGYALVDGEPPPARRGDPIELDRDATVGDAFQAIGRNCLTQLRGNAASMRAGVTPDGIHQLRVAIRRLRSGLYAFRKVLLEGERKRLTHLVSWIMRECAPARAWDVFVQECLEPLRTHLPDDAPRDALETFSEEVDEMRRAAHERAAAVLADPRFTATCLELESWWEAGGAVTALGEAAHLPAREFARESLRSTARRLIEEGEGLEDRAAEDLHVLRIRGKRLRYGAEFFRSLFRRKAVKAYLTPLAALQERLGSINDAMTAQALLADFDRERPPSDAAERERARALVAGWASAKIAEDLRKLPDLWADFTKVKPFWR